MPEPDGLAQLDQAGDLGRGGEGVILSVAAARANSLASPTGSAAAISSSVRVASGSDPSRWAKSRSTRLATGPWTIG